MPNYYQKLNEDINNLKKEIENLYIEKNKLLKSKQYMSIDNYLIEETNINNKINENIEKLDTSKDVLASYNMLKSYM